MANNFQRGDFLPVVWTPVLPVGAGTASTLSITGYDWEDMATVIDVTGTIHQGRRARIAGLADAQGNITLWFDLDSAPYNSPPVLRSGCLGLLQIQVSTLGTNPFQLGIIVEKMKWTSKIDSALAWNFDWKESVLAGAFAYPSGAFSTPGGPPGVNPQGSGTIPGTTTVPAG